MKVKVLVDNNSFMNHSCYGEPGASFYIEIDNKKILFDTGYSDIFIKNAEELDIDLKSIDYIVLSHGHDDHSGGLKYLDKYIDISKVKLVAHPQVFNFKESKGEICGAPFNLKEIINKTNFIPTDIPYKVSENCIYLGEIPVSNEFEKRRVLGKQEVSGEWADDYMLDDSAICCKTEEGLFIITGCSHSGICNIIERAKYVYNENRIVGVLGGFHLFQKDEKLEKTIQYFLDNDIKMIYPSHCTSLKVKSEILKHFDFDEVGVGFELEIK